MLAFTKGKGRALLKYSGYAVLTLCMTLYFTFVTFPYESVKDRYLPQMSKALPFSMDIGEIRGTPFLGIRGSDVVLYSRNESELQKDRKVIVTLEKVRIRPSLLSLIVGREAAHISGRLYGGQVKGKIGKKGPSTDLVASWKDISLRKFSDASKTTKMDGTFSGAIDLRMPGGDPSSSEGSIEVHISEGAIKEGLQVYSFSIPELNKITGTGRIKVGKEVGKGKASIEELSLANNEISLSLTGYMDLLPSLLQSRMNLRGSLKLSGKFAAQYDALLQGLLRNKDKDGSYPFSIRGTLSQPRFGI